MTIFTCGSCLYCRTDLCDTGNGVCVQFKNHPIVSTEKPSCPFGEKSVYYTTQPDAKNESPISSTIDERIEYQLAEKDYYETYTEIIYRIEQLETDMRDVKEFISNEQLSRYNL